MKSIVMPSTVQLSDDEKKQLAQEVKESIAKEVVLKEETFTASQMWNQQRQARSASAMLRRWNLN
jgi:hypothetical protein